MQEAPLQSREPEPSASVTLRFDGDRRQRRFELIYFAVLRAGDGKGARTRETLRAEARWLDALDAVSMPGPTAQEPDRRLLLPSASGLVCRPDDLALLLTYVNTVPWLPQSSRDAVDVQDFVEAAQQGG